MQIEDEMLQSETLDNENLTVTLKNQAWQDFLHSPGNVLQLTCAFAEGLWVPMKQSNSQSL